MTGTHFGKYLREVQIEWDDKRCVAEVLSELPNVEVLRMESARNYPDAQPISIPSGLIKLRRLKMLSMNIRGTEEMALLKFLVTDTAATLKQSQVNNFRDRRWAERVE